MNRRAVGAALALTGAGVAWTGTAAASPTDTVLIGDSIMLSVQDQVTPELRGEGWHVTLNAAGGTGLTPLTPARLIGATWDWQQGLAALEATYDPSVVVIVLGSNDVPSVEAGEDYNYHIDRLLSATDAPRVLWASCSTHTPDPDRNAACATINGDLRDARARRPGLEMVPLDKISSDPANLDPADGIHLSALGRQVLADQIATQVGPAPK